MKSVICAVLILIAIVGGGIIYTNRISDISKELCSIQRQASDHIQNDDYLNASECIKDIEEKLEKEKVFLGSGIDHNEVDDIHSNLAKIKMFVETENKSDALAYLESLNVHLVHLYESFKLKTENIL